MFFKDFQKDAFGYLTVDLIGKPGEKIEWAVREVSDGGKSIVSPEDTEFLRAVFLRSRKGKPIIRSHSRNMFIPIRQ